MLQVTEETSILELKSLVASELDIPVDRQRLVFEGKSMQGNTFHKDLTFCYNVNSDVCMYVLI